MTARRQQDEGEVLEGEVVEDRTVASLAIREIPQVGGLTKPAAPIAEIEEAFRAYQEVCRKILEKEDLQNISGKQYRKRSAWRKLSVAFSVTYEIVDRVVVRKDPTKPLSAANPVVFAEFVIRAHAPGGRYADGWGACDAFERCCPGPGCTKRHREGGHCAAGRGDDCPGVIHFSHANHDIPATAETRAKNRAAADLFGMGEVSAEEIVGEGEEAASGGQATGRGRSRSAKSDEASSSPSPPREKQPNQAVPKEEDRSPSAPARRDQWDAAKERFGSTSAVLKAFMGMFPEAPASTAKITQAQMDRLLGVAA